MAIQYEDGRYGETRPAAEVAEMLRDHFAGDKRLDVEPRRVLFGDTAEDVEAMKGEADIEALRDRLDALERRARIGDRGLVALPTPEQVRRITDEGEKR